MNIELNKLGGFYKPLKYTSIFCFGLYHNWEWYPIWVSAPSDLDQVRLMLNAVEEGALRDTDCSKSGWSRSIQSPGPGSSDADCIFLVSHMEMKLLSDKNLHFHAVNMLATAPAACSFW